MAYDVFTMNFQVVNTRRQTLEGKEYLVVPSVMMTPGVRTGSQGPILYLPEELQKTPSVWNYKPVTLYHPEMDGEQGMSACDPEIIEKQKIGLIMNTRYQDKLQNECWLDEAKAKSLPEGQKVLNSIAQSKMLEVSTGLYHDPDITPGVYDGQVYDAIARNIRGDHLAILLGQKGACSIEDGAGLLRNSDGELSYDGVREQLRALIRSTCTDGSYCYIYDIFPKYAIVEKGDQFLKVMYKVSKGKVTIAKGEPEIVRRVVSYVANLGQTTNEDHQGPLKSTPPIDAFTAAVQQRFTGIQQDGDWGAWTTDLYADYAIISKDGQQFRLPFTYDDDKITFDDDVGMEEVERVSEYRAKENIPIDGTMSPLQTNTETNMATIPVKPTNNTIHQGAAGVFQDPNTPNPNQHVVDQLIQTGRASDSDRSYLQALSVEQLQVISALSGKAPVAASAPAAPPTVTIPAAAAAALNAAPAAPQDLEQWLATAPPQVVQIVRNHQQTEQRVRAKCINLIYNKNPKFNKKWLESQTTDMLKGMAALATDAPANNSGANYGGQGDPIPMFVENTAADTTTNEDSEVLSLPNMGSWGAAS